MASFFVGWGFLWCWLQLWSPCFTCWYVTWLSNGTQLEHVFLYCTQDTTEKDANSKLLLCSPQKKTRKKTQLTTVKFNWFYVQWIFVASLHFFIISFFVLPQYSKCNACTMLYLCYGFKNESLLFHHLTFSCSITDTLQSKLPVHVL